MNLTTRKEFEDVYDLAALRKVSQLTELWPADSTVEVTDHGSLITISYAEEL